MLMNAAAARGYSRNAFKAANQATITKLESLAADRIKVATSLMRHSCFMPSEDSQGCSLEVMEYLFDILRNHGYVVNYGTDLLRGPLYEQCRELLRKDTLTGVDFTEEVQKGLILISWAEPKIGAKP